MKLVESINQQMEKTRSSLGYTQTKMATALGISQQAYRMIEKGKTIKIDQAIYEKYLKLIGENTSMLVNDTNKDEKIATLIASVKIITFELMQLRSKVTGESLATISMEYERLIKGAVS